MTSGEKLMSEISTEILELVSRGFRLRDAYDKVLGDGAYNRLVDDLYCSLRKKNPSNFTLA
jgi:hypothetical protein